MTSAFMLTLGSFIFIVLEVLFYNFVHLLSIGSYALSNYTLLFIFSFLLLGAFLLFLLILYECFVTITCTCKNGKKDSYKKKVSVIIDHNHNPDLTILASCSC